MPFAGGFSSSIGSHLVESSDDIMTAMNEVVSVAGPGDHVRFQTSEGFTVDGTSFSTARPVVDIGDPSGTLFSDNQSVSSLASLGDLSVLNWVGRFSDNNFNIIYFNLTGAPELDVPDSVSTAMLLGAGLLGLIVIRRRIGRG